MTKVPHRSSKTANNFREQISCLRIVRTSAVAPANAERPSELQNVKIETPEPSQPGMAERAIDTATDVSRTLTEVSAALQAAVGRLSDAITAARRPGMPLTSCDYPRSAADQPVRRLLSCGIGAVASALLRTCSRPSARLPAKRRWPACSSPFCSVSRSRAAASAPPQNLPFVESFAADMTPPVI